MTLACRQAPKLHSRRLHAGCLRGRALIQVPAPCLLPPPSPPPPPPLPPRRRPRPQRRRRPLPPTLCAAAAARRPTFVAIAVALFSLTHAGGPTRIEILSPLPDQDTKSHSNLIAIMNNLEKDMMSKNKPAWAPCLSWSDGQAFCQQGRTKSRFSPR